VNNRVKNVGGKIRGLFEPRENAKKIYEKKRPIIEGKLW